jgi:hypothetical protein
MNEMKHTFVMDATTDFFSHLSEHREKIKQELHHIKYNYNLFQQTTVHQKNNSNQHLLINKINQ